MQRTSVQKTGAKDRFVPPCNASPSPRGGTSQPVCPRVSFMPPAHASGGGGGSGGSDDGAGALALAGVGATFACGCASTGVGAHAFVGLVATAASSPAGCGLLRPPAFISFINCWLRTRPKGCTQHEHLHLSILIGMNDGEGGLTSRATSVL